MNQDISFINGWIKPDSRVLDLGCGDGSLLAALTQELNISGYGLEIDPESISQCVAKGVNVIEQDLNNSLHNFPETALIRSL